VLPLAALALAQLLGCSKVGPEVEIEGEVLYNQYCARCHGVQGIPVHGLDPPCVDSPTLPGCAGSFRDRQRMDRLQDEVFKGAVLAGRPATRRRNGIAPSNGMPAFPNQFTDATMMVLIAYVRGMSGSQGAHAPDEPQ